MPNWCYQNIIINCKNEVKAEELFKKIEEWTSHNFIKNGFGHNWLGNVVGNSGIDTIENGDFQKYGCRGEITDMDMYGEEITIHADTAWSPMLQLWKAVCDKYCPEAEITFEATEPGVGLFLTNDEDLIGKYNLDSWSDKIDPAWDISKEDLIHILKEYFESDSEDINYYNKLLYEQECDFSFHEWEKCDIADCY